MKLLVPEVKKCCFCISLKCGILVWSILKLLSSLMTILNFIQLIVGTQEFEEGIMLAILIAVYTVDLGFTAMLIFATFKSKVQLLKLYFKYSLTILFLFLISFIWSEQTGLPNFFATSTLYSVGAVVFSPITQILTDLLSLGFELYFIVIVNSFVEELQKNNKHIVNDNGSVQVEEVTVETVY